jgi:hypothetical protein
MISKEEVFKTVYGEMEWQHPGLSYRAADKDGLIYYFEKEPVIRGDFWTVTDSQCDFELHKAEYLDSSLFSTNLWKHSLQTRDEYMRLNGFETKGTKYEQRRQAWVEKAMMEECVRSEDILKDTQLEIMTEFYCKAYDLIQRTIGLYNAKTQRND